jgi:capsular exopolysaccharide synthesis family protein
VGFGLAFAREVFDPTLSDEASAEAELKLPVLTSIPIVGSAGLGERKYGQKPKRKHLFKRKSRLEMLPLSMENIQPAAESSIHVIDANVRDVILGPWTIAGEQYQMLRPELMLRRQKGLKSLIVTSATPNEGKTFVACCLAGILAKEPANKVLLIDADLRTANASRILGLAERNSLPGLTDVLKGEADVENCLLTCAELNLTFLPAGSLAENPVELLSSPRLQQVMRDLGLLFDLVIVDSPPVVPIADTNLLVRVCDSAIVVVRADRTPASLVKASINKIGREKVSGIVLNGVQNLRSTDYYGYYYHPTAQARK